MTTHTIYRVNITTLKVEAVTVTELENESLDGALQVEVMPSGMMRPLDPLGYYAESEKEAAEILLKYISAEIDKATSIAQFHQSAFNVAQERAELLLGRLNELEQEGHGLPEGRENGG